MKKEFDRCLRCGRRLKSMEHRLLGYGPSCYQKMKKGRLRKKLIIEVVQGDKQTRAVSDE